MKSETYTLESTPQYREFLNFMRDVNAPDSIQFSSRKDMAFISGFIGAFIYSLDSELHTPLDDPGVKDMIALKLSFFRKNLSQAAYKKDGTMITEYQLNSLCDNLWQYIFHLRSKIIVSKVSMKINQRSKVSHLSPGHE